MSQEKMKEWPPCPTIMGYDPDWEKKRQKQLLAVVPPPPTPVGPPLGRQGKRRVPLPP
jgi:hypothetical protein